VPEESDPDEDIPLIEQTQLSSASPVSGDRRLRRAKPLIAL